jgi:hypothetical protein
MKNKAATGCPICSDTFDRRADLRVHLMTGHAKSAMTDELLSVVAAADGRSP